MGITKVNSNYGEWIFSICSNCIFFLAYATHFSATLAFILFKAELFREYAEAFFYLTFTMLELSWYGLHILHRNECDDVFTQLDAIIAKSK